MVEADELAIMARLIVGIILRRNSFGAPIFFAHFLRQRYYQSAFSREVTKKVAQVIDNQVVPRAPPVIGAGWSQLKNLLAKWTGSTLSEQPQATPSSPNRAT